VAESGINAVCVIDTKELEILGHFPVGWFPSKLEVSKDGSKLYVANAKGFGSGPNAGPNFDKSDGTYIGNLMKGVVSVIDIPRISELKNLTQKVVKNNFNFSSIELKTDNNPIQDSQEKKSHQSNILFLFLRRIEAMMKYLVKLKKEKD